MAAPTVRSSSSGSQDVDQTAQSCTLPATISSGDLILVWFCHDGTPSCTWDNTTAGTFTNILNLDANTMRYTCWAKVADGTEDGAVLSPTTGNAQRSAWIAYAIQNWSGTLAGVEIASAEDELGTSTAPDPPSLTASWGALDNMFVAFAGCDCSAARTLSNYPLTDNQLADNNTTNGVSVIGSTQGYTATATVNPAAYTINAGDEWAAATVVVRPAAASTGMTPVFTGPFGGPFRGPF